MVDNTIKTNIELTVHNFLEEVAANPWRFKDKELYLVKA